MSNDDKPSLIDEIKKSLKEETIEQQELDDRVMAFFGSEIDSINNPTIASFVKSVLINILTEEPKEYTSAFWIAPSSNIPGLHPPDEYQKHGLLLHTKRMTRIAYDLSYTFGLTDEERDEVIAACILHDVTKAMYSTDPGNVLFDSMHMFTVDAQLEALINKDIDDANSVKPNTLDIPTGNLLNILRMIRCSHGMDSSIPEVIPVTDQERVVAAADHLASRLHIALPDLFLGVLYVDS